MRFTRNVACLIPAPKIFAAAEYELRAHPARHSRNQNRTQESTLASASLRPPGPANRSMMGMMPGLVMSTVLRPGLGVLAGFGGVFGGKRKVVLGAPAVV